MPAPVPAPPPELACPTCLGDLDPCDERRPIPSLECPRCNRVYSAEAGFLDFLELPHEPAEGPARGLCGLGPRLMHSRALARIYERLWRPFFVAVASGGGIDYASELAQILAWLQPARGGAIVDLSCGPGFTGRHLATSGEFSRVLGLDWSIAMLQRALIEAPELPLLRADVARLPFKHASLAGAHAGAALHMWPEPEVAIAELARVLRPGGVLVASTFTHRDALRPLTTAFQAASSARVFEIEELRGMCRAHGLRQFTAERRGALVIFAVTRA